MKFALFKSPLNQKWVVLDPDRNVVWVGHVWRYAVMALSVELKRLRTIGAL